MAGCIVTIDAIGCQTEIAQAIVDLDPDYVLAVKENQGHLYEDIHGLFEAAQEVNFKDVPHDYHKTTDKGHGRLEIHECWTITDSALLSYLRNRDGWRNLRTIVQVVAERRVNGATTREARYFISSLDGDARRMLNAVRGHGGIENSLHWVLDIAFDEDHQRVRKDNGPAYFAGPPAHCPQPTQTGKDSQGWHQGQAPQSRLGRAVLAQVLFGQGNQNGMPYRRHRRTTSVRTWPSVISGACSDVSLIVSPSGTGTRTGVSFGDLSATPTSVVQSAKLPMLWLDMVPALEPLNGGTE
jgi:predicted transposase YbfD/YdcC